MKKILSFTYKISDIYKLNYILSGYYLIQFILIIFIANSYTLPISTSYITRDQLLSKAYGKNLLSQANSHLFDVNVKILIIIMLLISIIIYALLATRYRYHYEKSLKHQVNTVRWIQNGVSNGLILIMVGLLAGIYDLAMLGVLFVLPIIANVIMLVEEKRDNQQQIKLSKWQILSFITAVIPLLVILCYVISADIYGVSGIATYYYFIFGTVILFYLANFINQLLRVKKFEMWKRYIYSEQVYMILEAVIKTALIWQIVVGVLRS